MVKIEILPNDESNFSKTLELLLSGRDCSLIHRIQHLVSDNVDNISSVLNNQSAEEKSRIQTLAEACAATSIQAFWRGKYHQIQKYCVQREELPSLRSPTPSHTAKGKSRRLASITIQRFWKSKAIPSQKNHVLAIITNKKENIIPEIIHSKNLESPVSYDNNCEAVDKHFTIQPSLKPELTCEGAHIHRYPLGTSKECTRREVIRKAREISLSKRKEILLRGIEIAKIFKDMELVTSEEYERTMKLVAKTKEEYGSSGIYYNIPLIGPVADFQKQVTAAWIIFTQKVHISQVMALKKAAKLKLDLVAKSLRSRILNLVDIQEESISFLVKNTGVMQYSKDCISAFLQTAGIRNMITAKRNLQWTLLNHLNELENRTQNAFLHGRIRTIIDTVHFISEWEIAGGCSASMNKEHDRFAEPNVENHQLEIAHLRRELDAKNKCIADLSHESEILKRRVEEEDNILCSPNSNGIGERNSRDDL